VQRVSGLTCMEISLKNTLSSIICSNSVACMKVEQGIDIEEFYQKYGPMVLRRCRSILKDEDAAYDAMQDVFIKLLQNRDRLKGDYPSSLLYRMATNICLNMIRDGRSIPVSPDDAIIGNIAHADDAHDRFVMNDFLNYVFRNEHESTRTMAYLHYVDGFTYEQVAAETGLSVSGVRKRLRTFQEKVKHLKEEAV
jgi:RNA polymerase sigma-70 factor, ECF subfamily